MKTYCPVYLDLQGRKCVVVGGGEVALRKTKILLDCGARVVVISPRFHPEIMRLAASGALEGMRRPYAEGDLKGAAIVISATNNRSRNREIAAEASAERVLINVVDDPERSDFIVPSFFRRGGLLVAVSSSGASPTLAKKIRRKIETEFAEEYAALTALAADVRSTLKSRGIRANADAWDRALDIDVLIELIRQKQDERARQVLLKSVLDGMVEPAK
jgi:precorrin-2 dehydrogenase / sirohydrochlorin ferrochelatase